MDTPPYQLRVDESRRSSDTHDDISGCVHAPLTGSPFPRHTAAAPGATSQARHKEGEMSDHDERWVLLHLIEMCRNEERALRFAAEHISDHGVRDLLEELASRRGAFAEELVPHAQRLGGAASDDTSKGGLRQRWAALKGALLGHREEALIKDAEHLERETLSTFEHALDDLLPETTHDLIEKQCAELRMSYARVRSLMH